MNKSHNIEARTLGSMTFQKRQGNCCTLQETNLAVAALTLVMVVAVLKVPPDVLLAVPLEALLKALQLNPLLAGRQACRWGQRGYPSCAIAQTAGIPRCRRPRQSTKAA